MFNTETGTLEASGVYSEVSITPIFGYLFDVNLYINDAPFLFPFISNSV